MPTWCPRAESNHGLMITNQLHDLRATGAHPESEARIIAEADGRRIWQGSPLPMFDQDIRKLPQPAP